MNSLDNCRVIILYLIDIGDSMLDIVLYLIHDIVQVLSV